MLKQRDTTTEHHAIDISKESFKNSRNSAYMTALSILFGLSSGVIGEKISEIYSSFNYNEWGDVSIKAMPISKQSDIFFPQIAAEMIGKAAEKQDTLLSEIEQYKPYFDSTIARQHNQFKIDVVKATKDAFSEHLPHDVSYYTDENNFEEFIKKTIPTLFGQYHIAVQFHEYEIKCKGAPPSLKFNLEIAQVDFHGLKSETLWGNTVQRRTTKLGTNFSTIIGSKHQYSINDWLGMYSKYSKGIFINEGEILGEYQDKIESAKRYLVFNGSTIDNNVIKSSGPQAKKEREACKMAIQYCARSILGYLKFLEFSLNDLTTETKFHEFGHAWRADNVPWLRHEDIDNRIVTEEAFAYAAEIGYAPRGDSVLFDLLEAKYISTSYQPHIQAKRRVFDLLVDEVIKRSKSHSPDSLSEDKVLSRSQAISSLTISMNNNTFRKEISRKIKDVLVEESKLSVKNILQEYSPFGNPANSIATIFGIYTLYSSILDGFEGKRKSAIKKATLKIDSLAIDKELKEKIKSGLAPFTLLDAESFESKRDALNDLASSSDPRAIEVALLLCKAYWRNLDKNKAFMVRMSGLYVDDFRKFAAFMLAPTLLEKFASEEHQENLTSKVLFSMRKSLLFKAKGNCFSNATPEVHSEYIDLMIRSANVKDNMPKEFVYLLLGLQSLVSPHLFRNYSEENQPQEA